MSGAAGNYQPCYGVKPEKRTPYLPFLHRSPEYSTWVGMIVTHYGRLGIGGADGIVPSAGTSSFSPRSTSIQQLRGYYSTGPSRSDTPGYESDGEDRHHLVAGISSRRRGALPAGQEVELMARAGGGGAGVTGGTAGTVGGTVGSYADERVRRRRAGELGEAEGGSSSSGGGAQVFEPQQSADPGPALPLVAGTQSPARPALFARQTAAAAARGGGPGSSSSTWKDALLERMKRVASQPALRSITTAVAPPPTGTSQAANSNRLSGLGGGGSTDATALLARQLGSASSSSGPIPRSSAGKKSD